MADKKKFEQILHFVSVFLLPFLTSKQIPAIELTVFQRWYSRAIAMQPIENL